jgi:hypothetical protein
MTGVAAMAKYPETLKKIFITQTYNNEGIIAARVRILGEQRVISIDDFLAFNTSAPNKLMYG